MESTINVSPQRIEWKQLWSLAALYASVVIGWIAYENYQPKLLVKFEFTAFAIPLAIAQGIILIITPPIAGRLGDKYRFSKGNRIPIITTGISFAAMIFMAVAFTLLTNPGEVFKWVLPLLIVMWLIAMSIFTSPALSTMELFTPVDKLPRTMAVLTIVANLLYALEPIIVDIIDYIGAPLTFMAGGVVVFVSGYALKQNALGLFNQTNGKEGSAAPGSTDSQSSSFGFILFMGLTLGLATALLFNYFPSSLQSSLHIYEINGKALVVIILAASAFLSWPISLLINRWGLQTSFWLSLAIVAVSSMGTLLLQIPAVVLLMIVLFAVSFTTLSVSALPLAMQKANYYEKVLGVGVFFSGVAVPQAFADVLALV
jgi:MFS family permease